MQKEHECIAEGKCHNCGVSLYVRFWGRSEDDLSDSYMAAAYFELIKWPCGNCGHTILPTDFDSNYVALPPTYIYYDNIDESNTWIGPTLEA